MQQQRPFKPLFDRLVLELVFDAHVAQHVVLSAQILHLVLQGANSRRFQGAVIQARRSAQIAILREAVAKRNIGVPRVVALGVPPTFPEVVRRLRVQPAKGVGRGLALVALGEPELAAREMIDVNVEYLRVSVSKHHGPLGAVEHRADAAFSSGQVVDDSEEPDGPGQTIELDDLFLGCDVDVAGVHLDAGYVAALECGLLREGQQ